MVSYNPSKRIRHFSVCLTAAAVTDGVSTYSACGNLVDQVILPTRGLFRAVRPQIPSCNALQVLRTALERTYLRRRGGNRCSFARNEIIHKSIFLKYIHELCFYIFINVNVSIHLVYLRFHIKRENSIRNGGIILFI